MDLSICIVSRNIETYLRPCLKSIFDSPKKLELEVIVVDNASTDGTVEMVQKEFPQVRLIRNQDNLMFAHGNNQAIEVSQGDYILILNSDTEIHGDSLELMVNFLKTHPEVGTVSCRMIGTDGDLQHCNARDYTFPMAMINYTFWGHIFSGYKKKLNYLLNYEGWDRTTSREVDWIGDANMMLSRKALQAIGGYYDETFKIYYTENEICLRLREKGYKVYYLAEGEVLHHERRSVTREGLKKISKIYEDDTIAYYKKYHGTFGAYFLSVSMKMTNVLVSIKNMEPRRVLQGFLQPAKNQPPQKP